jgi:hypothetical protein
VARVALNDAWLLDFNAYLQIWGFATDRTLSSTEYQLFNKYQSAASGLNQLAQINTQVSATRAIITRHRVFVVFLLLVVLLFQAMFLSAVCY